MRFNLQIRDAYVCSRTAPGTLIRMVESGVLRLDRLQVQTFGLADITDASEAANKGSVYQFAVLEPNN